MNVENNKENCNSKFWREFIAEAKKAILEAFQSWSEEKIYDSNYMYLEEDIDEN